MKLELLKTSFLYNPSLSPHQVLKQGEQEGHGKLLLDIVDGIFQCIVHGVAHEHHRERLRSIILETEQRLTHRCHRMTDIYRTQILSLLDQIRRTNFVAQERPQTQTPPMAASAPAAAQVIPPVPPTAAPAPAVARDLPPATPAPLLSRGLSNAGCTCYANAVLNLVLLAPNFRELLQHRTSPVGIALRDVQAALFQPETKPLSCTEGPLFVLLRELQKVFPNISSRTAQDSEEFLRCLLEHIGYQPIPFLIQQELPSGQILGRRVDPFTIIPLNIHALDSRLKDGSLQNILDQAIDVRRIGLRDVELRTKLTLAQVPPPQVLFFNLIRYNEKMEKDTRPIIVPEYIIVDTDRRDSLPYRLHGAALHHDGHYTMIERHESGWILHDDAKVQQLHRDEGTRLINERGVLFSYELGR